MPKEKKQLSKALKTFFGVGDLGFNWMTNIETYYFAYFLTNVAQFPMAMVTMVQTIGSVIDAALSWVYGIMLNKIKPLKWGRYRSWLAVLPWVVPFLYLLQFRAFGNGMGAALIIVFGTVSSHIAWNIPYVANMAMVNVASDSADDRNALSSVRTLWTYLARMSYSYVGPGLVAFFTAKLSVENAYAATAFALGAVMAALYFAHFVMFSGYEETGAEEIARLQKQAEQQQKSNQKTAGIGAAIASNPQILGVLGAYLFYMMYSFCFSAFAVYYGQYIALDAGFMTKFLLISNITAVVGSIVSRKVAQKLSSKGTFQLALLGIAVLYFCAYIMKSNPTVVIILMSVGGFFAAFATAMTVPMLANCSIYSEYKTGVNCTGAVMGFLNVPIKIAVIGRGLLISTVLGITGFNPSIAVEEASDAVKNGIAIGFTVIPAILLVIGFLIITFGYHIKESDIEKYSAEIKARKQA
ncbi:MAG: Na+/melibiose symporter and related transporter [Lachnospiraceae bacterium]|nr:Na+/melibiose symporter and related transporter [Lachnospiraceae bacterium]